MCFVPLSFAFPHEGADRSLAGRARARSLQAAVLLLAAAAVALAVVAYRVQVQNHSRPSWAAASVVVASAFVVAGLLAWLRRPANRLGPLLLAAGVALLARQLRYSQEALLFTFFFLLGDIGYALVGHAILAYPTGKVRGRWSRLLMKAGYATVIAFPVAVLLLHGSERSLLQMGPLPRRSLIALGDRAHTVELLQRTQVVVFFGVLVSLWIAVIVWRLWSASSRTRRILAPLVVAAVAVALRAVYEVIHTFVNREPFAYSFLFWWWIAASFALPLVLLAGMLRARLARGNIGELVLELDRTPATPTAVRDALARAVADPSLELLFWLPERGEFVDTSGVAATPPPDGGGRALTRLDQDSAPVALVVHDASLLDEPELITAAGAAARLALENARLQAETRAQLEQVRESRRRIVSVADAERRRIERNLHDGAQQRLLALALQLTRAQRRPGAEIDPEMELLLAASVEELQGTIAELRTLARGLHPTVLTEYGLAGALAALTSKSTIPVALEVSEERLPPELEATAYFVVCEALNNVAKHAHAEHASIAIRSERERLLLEIADDGAGGAQASDGSGLQGMADRVEALGGRLRVHSWPGEGTRICVELPCVR
jgi:signal transduction histidine kinase